MSDWFLEGYFSGDRKLTRLHLVNLPQNIGRDPFLALTITAPSISRNHARIELIGGFPTITDLGSSNGTFVNRERISLATQLRHGDVIHLGMTEMRIIDTKHGSNTMQEEEDDDSGATRVVTVRDLSNKFPVGVHDLEELITKGAVDMMYQPIIRADDLSTCGYEILGRGGLAKLPPSPLALFNLAESFELEVELSELMRNKGIDLAVTHNLRGDILVNTHPSEMQNVDRLLADLGNMRKRHPDLQVILEIHEQAVTDQKDILKSFSAALTKLNIKLAFDDFGVGQSRLMELIDAKPDLIKFDRALIKDLDKGDPSRYNLLKHLKDLAEDLDIKTLAEGVETEGEYNVCKTMNFGFYQGYYFAKPAKPETF